MTVKEEYDWYKSRRDEIVAGHENEFVIIKDRAVAAYYKIIDDAFDAAEKLEPGTFILMVCKPKADNTTCHNNPSFPLNVLIQSLWDSTRNGKATYESFRDEIREIYQMAFDEGRQYEWDCKYGRIAEQRAKDRLA